MISGKKLFKSVLLLSTLFLTFSSNGRTTLSLFSSINSSEINFIGNTSTYQYELAITAIFQNEAAYLKEWLEFHKLVGVTHFYLYNNFSSDHYVELLSDYIERGEVDLIEWPYGHTNQSITKWHEVQMKAYQDATERSRGKAKWLAVIDLDEFIVPVMESNLIQFLSDYEDDRIGGVCANWQMYGTSNIAKIPANHLMIEALLLKASPDFPDNRFVKTMVRPERVQKCGIHNTQYFSKYVTVNSDKKISMGSRQNLLLDKIRINHYWTRDEDYCFNKKLPRLKNTTKWKSEEQLINLQNTLNQEVDPIMLRFTEELKKLLSD